MSSNRKDPKFGLDEAVSAMRALEPKAEVVETASAEVWQRMQGSLSESHMIRSCEEVRAQLPLFRAGTLPKARYLLIADHLQECVPCRHFAEAGEAEKQVEWKTAVPAAAAWRPNRMAVAFATVVLMVSGLATFLYFGATPAGARARVEKLDGTLYLLQANGSKPLAVGEELLEGQVVRTANGAHAFVRLSDGSLVEVNERAELSVTERWKDTTLHLDRGRIIVQAAKRKSGHLYVITPDSRVAVTGTVFAVNSGTVGSRVAVIEGEVHVFHDGAENVLHSDDTLTTSPAVGDVPVKQEIAWSENYTEHLKLLAAFSRIERQMEQIPGPAPRFESKLLPLVPQDSMIYVAIPNVAETLRQLNQIIGGELQQSPELAKWWTEAGRDGRGVSPQQVVAKIQTVNQYLGDEIVFATSHVGPRHGSAPVLISQIAQQGLKEYLQSEIGRLTSPGERAPRVLSAEDLAGIGTSKDDLYILVRQDYLVVSTNLEAVQQVNAELNAGAPSGFAATGFGQRLQQAYSKGAGVIFAADMQRVYAESEGRGEKRDAEFAATGFADMRYVVFEYRDENGKPENRVALEFNGERKGIASWLAAPAPMGSLDFISSDASIVASVVAKSPAQMLDDVLKISSAANPRAQQNFQEFQAKLNLNIRDDLAVTLGSDATVALDGPVLPTPSWKFVAEVYDSARLQNSIERLVAEGNQESAAHGHATNAQVVKQEEDGRVFYEITTETPAPTIWYTFVDGYIVVAPSKALVVASLETHTNGMSLAKSANFRSLVSASSHLDYSAFLYQNLGPVLQPLSQTVGADQMQALQQLAADSRPTLVGAYGGADSVEIVSNSRFLGMDFNTLALFGALGEKGTTVRRTP